MLIKKGKNKKLFLLSLLMLSILVFSGYLLFGYFKSKNLKDYENEITRTYLTENGFLTKGEAAIDDYRRIFDFLNENNINLRSLKGEPSVEFADAQVDKVLGFLVEGGQCKKLGVNKPRWLASFTYYEEPWNTLQDLDNLLIPLLEGESVTKKEILALMAFGEQMCDYDDVLVHASGLHCKNEALRILSDRNSDTVVVDPNLLSKIKFEIKDEFEYLKERSKKP